MGILNFCDTSSILTSVVFYKFNALIIFAFDHIFDFLNVNRSALQLKHSTSVLIVFDLFFGYWLLKYHESESRGRGAVRDWSKVFRKPGRQRAGAGFRVGVTRAGGHDHGGEPDHVPARLRGPGLSRNTFVLSSNRARVWGDDDL
jgi:hypothetical protein